MQKIGNLLSRAKAGGYLQFILNPIGSPRLLPGLNKQYHGQQRMFNEWHNICRKIQTLGSFNYKCQNFHLNWFFMTKILKKEKGCLIFLNTVQIYEIYHGKDLCVSIRAIVLELISFAAFGFGILHPIKLGWSVT